MLYTIDVYNYHTDSWSHHSDYDSLEECISAYRDIFYVYQWDNLKVKITSEMIGQN